MGVEPAPAYRLLQGLTRRVCLLRPGEGRSSLRRAGPDQDHHGRRPRGFRRKAPRGTCVRTPAPSPVRESAPTPPRWVRLTRPDRARSTIWRDGRPAMSTTSPTPHESRSNAGSQSGAVRSAKRGGALHDHVVSKKFTLATRALTDRHRASARALRPQPESIPAVHSSVGLVA